VGAAAAGMPVDYAWDLDSSGSDGEREAILGDVAEQSARLLDGLQPEGSGVRVAAPMAISAVLLATAAIATVAWTTVGREAPVSHLEQRPVVRAFDNGMIYPARAESSGISMIAQARNTLMGPPLQAARSWGIAIAPTNVPAACSVIESNVYYPGNDLRSAAGTMDPESCCQKCADEAACVAWSWEKESWACALKGAQPRQELTRIVDTRFTSGRPAHAWVPIRVVDAKPGQSLFCFSLMLPLGYEPTLLKWQYTHSVSIFGCDEYAVYSNMSLAIAHGLRTKPIASDLVCRKGGEFRTALNTDIFMAVWARVIDDNRFIFHDWTVKVDPDAVFLPAKLRTLVQRHPEEAGGVYLNNCELGMHGPLEVLSRLAVQVWWAGATRCQRYFTRLCSGSCQWGEDMFLDQCLMKVLHVKREDERGLLLEDHCNPPFGWEQCTDKAVAAFHPFKDVSSYSDCILNANMY